VSAKKKQSAKAQERTPQLFDKIAKRLLRLSGRAVIRCINGLYDVNYPLHCPVEYPNPVSVNSKLQERRADMFMNILDDEPHCFHLEVQTDDALNMVIRMFEYDAAYAIATSSQELVPGARKKADAMWMMKFPAPLVLCWDARATSPDTLTVRILFSDKGSYDYEVPVFKLLDYTVGELEAKGLVILLPFCVIKFRDKVKEARTVAARVQLAAELRVIVNDVLAAFDRGVRAGYVLADDREDLIDSTDRLLRELYHPYTEFTEVKEMVKGIYETSFDKARKQIAAEKQNAEAEKRNGERNVEAEKRNTEAALRNAEAEKRNAEAEKRNAEAEKRNAEAANKKLAASERNTEEMLRNLEQLGVPRAMIEQARAMQAKAPPQ
jgi:hypothetical protein